MFFKKLPDITYLKSILQYVDGDLIWVKNDKIAGYKRPDNRIVIRIQGNSYMAHRLIFKITTGIEPKEIDHINGDPSDNRIENLREISRSQNSYNTNLRSTNKSGFKGVCFDKSRSKWIATISNNYKTINLGRYDCIGQAILARKKAELIYID